MKKLLVACVAAGCLAAGLAIAQTAGGGMVSLRGETPIDEVNEAPSVFEQSKPSNGFGRAYRQQPPLIPHRVDSYQVTKAFNKCVSCHGWPQHVQFGAPKISETHYVTRDGERTDQISGSRWFCTQCHVPQDDTRALVPNAFKNASELGGAFQ